MIVVCIVLGTECGILLKSRKIAYVRAHGAIEGPSEDFACGVDCGVDGGYEAMWECSLVGYVGDCVLRVASFKM